MYEIAHAYGSMCKCWLYTVHPRQCVTQELIADITSPAVIVVEEDYQAPDPLDIFSLNQVNNPCLYALYVF